MDAVSLHSDTSSITLLHGPAQDRLPNSLVDILSAPTLVLTQRPEKKMGSSWFDFHMMVSSQDGKFLGEISFHGSDWQRGLGVFGRREYQMDLTDANGNKVLKFDRGGDDSFGTAKVYAYDEEEEEMDTHEIGEVQYEQRRRKVFYALSDSTTRHPQKMGKPFALCSSKLSGKKLRFQNESGETIATAQGISTGYVKCARADSQGQVQVTGLHCAL